MTPDYYWTIPNLKKPTNDNDIPLKVFSAKMTRRISSNVTPSNSAYVRTIKIKSEEDEQSKTETNTLGDQFFGVFKAPLRER